MRRVFLAGFCALALAGPAAASEERPTLAELEKELVCPTCATTLELSNAPIAERMRAFIRQRIEAGDTKSEIKAKLVEQFGEGVLAAPPRRGFNWLAWVVPAAGGVLAGAVLTLLARRWRAGETRGEDAAPSANGRAPLDPELERRVDAELARLER